MQPKLWHKKTEFFSPNSCSKTCCSKTMKKNRKTNKQKHRDATKRVTMRGGSDEQLPGATRWVSGDERGPGVFRENIPVLHTDRLFCPQLLYIFIISPQISFLTNNIQESFFCSFFEKSCAFKAKLSACSLY